MTSSASTAAFRILVAVMLAAAVFLDLTLAHARATGRLPMKPAADCTTLASSLPTPPPASAAPAAPPGILAAFGSCGDGAPQSASPSIRK